MILRIKPYIFIIIDNCIPPIGYFFLDWDMSRIFIFYAVELCAYELVMIPRIIIFSYTSDEYILSSRIKKFGLSISWLLYHLMLYTFTMMFLLHTGFAVSPGAGAPVTMADLWSFVDKFKLVIIYIFAAYIFEFFTDYLRRKEYEVLPSDLQLKEIALFYFLLLVVLGFINGFAVAFSLDGKIYQIVMLFIVIGVKTLSQVFLRKGKSKYIS